VSHGNNIDTLHYQRKAFSRKFLFIHFIILNTKEINNIGYFLASKNSSGEVNLRAWGQYMWDLWQIK